MNHKQHSQDAKASRVGLTRLFAGIGLVTIIAIAAIIIKAVKDRAVLADNSLTLTVDVGADRHPISPDIYGMNYYDVTPAFAKELQLPVQRWGGDATSRYNWQVDSTNAGADFFFMGGGGKINPVPSGSADDTIKSNKASGSQTIMTVPMLGYVNKTAAWNCSFPVSRYGQQQQINPYIHLSNGDRCGNGISTDGKQLIDKDILSNHIVSNPKFIQSWIKHLISVHGTAARGGVQFYQMDNEPSGWSNTHRDVHPQQTGYDELRDRTYAYASMVKATDPSAKILGPADFGWPVYVGLDNERAAHGGTWEAEWYLQQMRTYEQQHGVRILDYFDEHYYPVTGNTPVGDRNTQTLRLRSTRSLWDSTYTDEAWFGKYYPPLQLLPRFRQWVSKNYPGTKIAITEYNWGGLESMNGALAQADVLGIFGREGLDLATLWGPPKPTQPGAYAFRMYRNYDGKGSAYGDTWVRSTSTDQGRLAIYGAQRQRDGAITLIIINKTGNDLTTSLMLKGYKAAAAQVYTYSQANLSAILHQPDLVVNTNGWNRTYTANSITLIVIPKG